MKRFLNSPLKEHEPAERGTSVEERDCNGASTMFNHKYSAQKCMKQNLPVLILRTFEYL